MTRSQVVKVAQDAILRSTDWQEVQNVLSNDDSICHWLEETGTDSVEVIRDAENRLGNRIPATYSN